eukprot:4582927-Prorocentrum_lima.AAC.1
MARRARKLCPISPRRAIAGVASLPQPIPRAFVACLPQVLHAISTGIRSGDGPAPLSGLSGPSASMDTH